MFLIAFFLLSWFHHDTYEVCVVNDREFSAWCSPIPYSRTEAEVVTKTLGLIYTDSVVFSHKMPKGTSPKSYQVPGSKTPFIDGGPELRDLYPQAPALEKHV